MIRQGAADLELDPTRSYVVGDKWSDVALAHTVGATGILVQTGYGAAQAEQPDRLVTAELMAATVSILKQ